MILVIFIDETSGVRRTINYEPQLSFIVWLFHHFAFFELLNFTLIMKDQLQLSFIVGLISYSSFHLSYDLSSLIFEDLIQFKVNLKLQ